MSEEAQDEDGQERAGGKRVDLPDALEGGCCLFEAAASVAILGALLLPFSLWLSRG